MDKEYEMRAQSMAWFTTPTEQAPTMAEYRRRLAAADWQYQFSDDRSVRQRASADFEELRSMQRTLDSDGTIWREYSRDRKGTPMPDVRRADAVEGGVA